MLYIYIHYTCYAYVGVLSLSASYPTSTFAPSICCIGILVYQNYCCTECLLHLLSYTKYTKHTKNACTVQCATQHPPVVFHVFWSRPSPKQGARTKVVFWGRCRRFYSLRCAEDYWSRLLIITWNSARGGVLSCHPCDTRTVYCTGIPGIDL